MNLNLREEYRGTRSLVSASSKSSPVMLNPVLERRNGFRLNYCFEHKNFPYLKTFTCGFDLSSASGIELGFDERVRAEAMSASSRPSIINGFKGWRYGEMPSKIGLALRRAE